MKYRIRLEMDVCGDYYVVERRPWWSPFWLYIPGTLSVSEDRAKERLKVYLSRIKNV